MSKIHHHQLYPIPHVIWTNKPGQDSYEHGRGDDVLIELQRD